MSKDTAKALVIQFNFNTTIISQWPKIAKLDLASGLLARVDNPNLINQAGTPLCGPASVIHALATNNPDAYVQAAIDLYSKGKAQIGTLTLSPGNNLKQAAVPANTDPADWIMLGSVRDSSNWFLSPADGSDQISPALQYRRL